jgi:hypothetical protein
MCVRGRVSVHWTHANSKVPIRRACPKEKGLKYGGRESVFFRITLVKQRNLIDFPGSNALVDLPLAQDIIKREKSTPGAARFPLLLLLQNDGYEEVLDGLFQ